MSYKDSRARRIDDLVYSYNKVRQDAQDKLQQYAEELMELESKVKVAKLLGMDRKTLYNKHCR